MNTTKSGLNVHDLGLIRRAIMHVLTTGDYSGHDQFCDAVQNFIVNEVAPALSSFRLDEPTTITQPPWYDYTNQAWVINGAYAACAHPESMDCQCYGKLHTGEPPTQNIVEQYANAQSGQMRAEEVAHNAIGDMLRAADPLLSRFDEVERTTAMRRQHPHAAAGAFANRVAVAHIENQLDDADDALSNAPAPPCPNGECQHAAWQHAHEGDARRESEDWNTGDCYVNGCFCKVHAPDCSGDCERIGAGPYAERFACATPVSTLHG